MYCSACGKPVGQGLSYCKHCGARVGSTKERDVGKVSETSNSVQLSEASLNLLVGGILGLPIAGLGIVIGLISVLKKEIGLGNELIVVVTFLSFLLLLAAESAFIWLLIQRSRTRKEKREDATLKEGTTKKLAEAQVLGLPDPIPSVTENTTRSFEPIASETKTQ